MATFAAFRVQQLDEGHPQSEELGRASMGMLAVCADARGIKPEDFTDWMKAEQLDDPNVFLPALEAALIDLVPEDQWAFDREDVSA